MLSLTLYGFEKKVAYIRGWEMSLVLTAVLPAMGITAYIFTWLVQNMTNKT